MSAGAGDFQPQIFRNAVADFVGQLFQADTRAEHRRIFNHQRRGRSHGDQQPQQHGQQKSAQRADLQQERMAGMEVADDAIGEKKDAHGGEASAIRPISMPRCRR